MFHKFQLQSLQQGGPTLEFEWDDETGAVRGRDASRVRQLVEAAEQAGEICGAPHPTVYEITDALGDAKQLAVVVGQFWLLEGLLRAAIAQWPSADEDEIVIVDADGTETRFKPVH